MKLPFDEEIVALGATATHVVVLIGRASRSDFDETHVGVIHAKKVVCEACDYYMGNHPRHARALSMHARRLFGSRP